MVVSRVRRIGGSRAVTNLGGAIASFGKKGVGQGFRCLIKSGEPVSHVLARHSLGLNPYGASDLLDANFGGSKP